jgi:hypothetical protein
MANVLQEVTEADLSPAHIERRVDDWITRIRDLYAAIESWLPDGWSAQRGRNVRMHEELMRRFGVAPRELPVLDLMKDGQRVASIEPRGLWIIGANGRLDLTRGTDRYVIVDEAENFAQPSWRIAPFSDRRQTQQFGREELISLL